MENNVWHYSDKELRLILHYGYEDLVDNPHIAPCVLYGQVLVYKAFMRNINDKYDQSLRRCIQALENNSPLRATDEWDNLIDC